ncbi:MAG: PIG-L family deacetylase [Paludibacteraceae bacterium]|nr:PIG-L family deacetylase [Paludibacteraceae bacterium]
MKKFFILLLVALVGINITQAQTLDLSKYHKALIIGAHPDDPESMCGGTMILLREAGCDVVSVYLTRGERGIEGKSLDETATIRTEEALKACALMDVRPVFLTQVDGESEINKARYAEMKALIEREKPDLVITHWPIDSHRDHRNCSVLVYDAWRQTGHSFDLFYGEVMTGLQTQNFTPTVFVNIDSTRERKIAAYLSHVSQGVDKEVKRFHDTMETMRGLDFQCRYAEAFVQQRWGD